MATDVLRTWFMPETVEARAAEVVERDEQGDGTAEVVPDDQHDRAGDMVTPRMPDDDAAVPSLGVGETSR